MDSMGALSYHWSAENLGSEKCDLDLDAGRIRSGRRASSNRRALQIVTGHQYSTQSRWASQSIGLDGISRFQRLGSLQS